VRIVLATGNADKVAEMRPLLPGAEVSAAPEGFDPEETGTTLLQNAWIKAAALRDRLVDGAGEAAGGDDPAERIAGLVEREAGVLDPGTRSALAARVAERAVGLGPLEPFLRDGAVDEIMVCGTGPVWVERGGRLEATSARFGSEAELRHAIERILACSAERVALQGEVLALPNDPGSGMFVIEEGTVAVELRSGTIELGPGDFFGELALLVEDGARVARVRATSPVRCISIPREDFLALVETEPRFALALLRELARRLAEARATG